MTRRAAAMLMLLLSALAGFAPAAAEEPLVADLSSHLIAITTGFTGTDVVLFGAVDGAEDNAGEVIVVVVRGPSNDIIVRRKQRVMGIWINRDQVRFNGTPSYYALASSRPFDSNLDATILTPYGIGLDRMALTPETAPGDLGDFRAALVRRKVEAGAYVSAVGQVAFLGNQLFRVNFHFPANVPTGSYLIEVLLVRGGEVVSAQTTPLVIGKIGLGAEIYDFAHRHAAFYGLGAIAGALLAGFAAHLMFRRR